MYTSYFYNSVYNKTEVLADIVALATGVTDKASLSASSNQTDTAITATISAGWTLHDAIAGTNAQCIKSAISDDPTKFKYVVIDTNTAGQVKVKVYEGWNATTHVGTNMCSYSDLRYGRLNTSGSGGGRIELKIISTCFMLFTAFSTTFGDDGSAWSLGCSEYPRTMPFDTIANGFPPFFSFAANGNATTGSYIAKPRSLGGNGYEGTTTFSRVYLTTLLNLPGTPLPTLNTTTVACGADKGLRHVLLPLYLMGEWSSSWSQHDHASFSAKCEMWLTTYNSGTAFDEIIEGSFRYAIWSAGAYRFAVRVN